MNGHKFFSEFISLSQAHCVSTWGADFRPHYRRLDCLKRLFPRVPILALTATATPRVRKDILISLKIQNAKTFVGSFDRQNLYYEVRYKECINDLYQDIVSVINNLGRTLSSIRPVDIVNPSGIIYAPTRARVEQATEELSKRGILIESYHAGMNAANRQAVFKRWLSNETRVIASTVAFGMGIDKPDCRFVIHEGVPGSMENYYQESGRAGRDGLPSLALLYYSQRDKSRQIFFARGKIASAASDGDASVYTDAQSDEGVVPLFQPMITFCEPFTNKANKPCRRRLLLQHFSESERCTKAGDTCCDLCRDMSKAEANFRRSLEERNEEATERRVVNSLAARLRAKRGPKYASDSDGAEVDEYSNHRRTKQKGDPTFFDYSMEAAQEEHDDESSHGNGFHGVSLFKPASQAPARLPPKLLNAAVKDETWRNKVFDAMEKAENRAEQREKVSNSRSSLLAGFAKAPSSAVMRPFRPPAPLQSNSVKPATSTASEYPVSDKLLEPSFQVPGGLSVQERSRVFNLLCDALRSAGIESADAERIVANNELRVLKECKVRQPRVIFFLLCFISLHFLFSLSRIEVNTIRKFEIFWHWLERNSCHDHNNQCKPFYPYKII
jgi:RecQ family ATP-dependent DNA helicase